AGLVSARGGPSPPDSCRASAQSLRRRSKTSSPVRNLVTADPMLSNVAHKPKALSFVEAAAAPLVTITAWEALRERARASEKQFVLVQAGAGGVGHMSVQIARLAGARVAATVTPGRKAELAASLGAEQCIDYRREDVGARLRAWTGMDGADVVHDTVGGKTFTACFSLVRPYGDLV